MIRISKLFPISTSILSRSQQKNSFNILNPFLYCSHKYSFSSLKQGGSQESTHISSSSESQSRLTTASKATKNIETSTTISETNPSNNLNKDISTSTNEQSTASIGTPSFKLSDFFELTKFKLCVMNTFVALPTFIFYSGNVTAGIWIPLAIATQLMAMSSQTTNQILEKDFDAQMLRTQRRPLPAKLITPNKAWMLAGSTFLASNAIFLSCFPLETAFVANAIFFGYIGIYTPMKRWTNFNTAVGAVIGALTPYIGYSAAGGSLLDLYPLCYSIYMTFWQFQHFYGIAWIYKNDYLRAGYKMCHEKNEALFYMSTSFALNVAANIALFASTPVYASLPYVYSAIMACTYMKKFVAPTMEFYKYPNVNTAKKLKNASYVHLSVFFLIIIFDMCLRIYQNKCKVQLENEQQILGNGTTDGISSSSSQEKSEKTKAVGLTQSVLFHAKLLKNFFPFQNTETKQSVKNASIIQERDQSPNTNDKNKNI